MIGITNAVETYRKMNFGTELTFKTFDGVKWVKIYYHDVSAGYWPTDESICKHNTATNLFSLLGFLDSLTATPGTYEFMLEYPGVSGYWRWRQTSDPTVSSTVTGYTALNISGDGGYFKGLRKVSTSSTWLQADSSTSWFWAICSHVAWNSGVPLNHNTSSSTTKIELWLKTV